MERERKKERERDRERAKAREREKERENVERVSIAQAYCQLLLLRNVFQCLLASMYVCVYVYVRFFLLLLQK